MNIQHIDAFQVFDSRGNPTVEAWVTLEDGSRGTAIVPSGASTGRYEARELRDGIATRFSGKSVEKAIGHVRDEIASALRGFDVFDQAVLDARLIGLDGTANKSRLGANAILAVSMACCAAGAVHRRQPLFEYLSNGEGVLLPLPEIQIIGGGAHAGRAVDIQDYLVMAVGATSYGQALEMTYNVYQATAEILRGANQLFGVADEGGFWPVFRTNEAALEVLLKAIERAGYAPGTDVAISIDFAASDLYRDGRYQLATEGRSYSTTEFIKFVISWLRNYPILSIEDPLAEDDWEGWKELAVQLDHGVQLIGDDLFVTNIERIRRGQNERCANAVLIKINQIGTITETLAAIRATQQGGWRPVISARSGETEDTFIAHLAVATNAGQIKVGSFTRGERTAKWNELLRIERSLGARAKYRGASVLYGNVAEGHAS